jgi:hypothetical protein
LIAGHAYYVAYGPESMATLEFLSKFITASGTRACTFSKQ